MSALSSRGLIGLITLLLLVIPWADEPVASSDPSPPASLSVDAPAGGGLVSPEPAPAGTVWVFTGSVQGLSGSVPEGVTALSVVLTGGVAAGPNPAAFMSAYVRSDGSFALYTDRVADFYYLRLVVGEHDFCCAKAVPGPGTQAFDRNLIRYPNVVPGDTLGILLLSAPFL